MIRDYSQQQSSKFKSIMIKLSFTAASNFDNQHSKQTSQYVIKPKILIGRGEELLEKQNQKTIIIDNQNMSQLLSRVHAEIRFSPAWFQSKTEGEVCFPSYFAKIGQSWSQLPLHNLYQIWQFAKPKKQVFIKDLKSKAGLYQNIQKIEIFSGLEVMFGDLKKLKILNRQVFHTFHELNQKALQLKQKGYLLLRPLTEESRQFWLLQQSSKFYILPPHPTNIVIGRSSNCDIIIGSNSISRKQALLKMNSQNQWIIHDGDGKKESQNGLWKKIKRKFLCYSEFYENMTKIKLKIADILTQIQVTEDSHQINILDEISFTKEDIVPEDTKLENDPIQSKYSL